MNFCGTPCVVRCVALLSGAVSLCSAWTPLGASGGEAPRLEVLSVEINDRRLPKNVWGRSVGERARPFEVGSVRSLRVEFREAENKPGVAHQLRHALEGHGNRWNPVVAHAQMTVRFLDEHLKIVASSDYTFGAESSGWRGVVEGSVFHPREAHLEAPDRARWVQLLAVPSVPAMVGVYAFRDVRVFAQSGAEAEVRVRDYSAEEGADMDKALGSPLNWARTGTRGEQAKVLRMGDGTHALAVVDDDPRVFGGWILPTEKLAAVLPGDRVRVEWRECFSVARGGQGVAEYGYLEPGKNYRLQMGLRSVEGREVEGGTVLSFYIPPPPWQRPVVWVWSGVGVLGVSLGAVRSLTKRRIQRRIEELDRRNAVERERSRIARDIHDELGASLSQISLLSCMAREGVPEDSPMVRHLDEITRRAGGAARQLSEIVWAVNPSRDSTEHLIGFVGTFAQEYLSLAGVGFRTDLPEDLAEMPLGASVRYNVFLAVRELIHNAVRHGRPSFVLLRVRCDRARLCVEIEDDGCGFDVGSIPEGRGLANVRERMRQVGGVLEMRPGEKLGSILSLKIPLDACGMMGGMV